jgi:hypothetical protein
MARWELVGFWIWGFRRGWARERRPPQNGKAAGFWGCWLRINCLAALPPMAAVFHAFSFPPACLPAAASVAPPCTGCMGCRRQEPSHRRRAPCLEGESNSHVTLTGSQLQACKRRVVVSKKKNSLPEFFLLAWLRPRQTDENAISITRAHESP